MVNTLTSFPNLPLLTFEASLEIVRKAGINTRRCAIMAGVSRQALWLRSRGTGSPGGNVDQRMALLAYMVMLWSARNKQLAFSKKDSLEVMRTALAVDAKSLANACAETFSVTREMTYAAD